MASVMCALRLLHSQSIWGAVIRRVQSPSAIRDSSTSCPIARPASPHLRNVSGSSTSSASTLHSSVGTNSIFTLDSHDMPEVEEEHETPSDDLEPPRCADMKCKCLSFIIPRVNDEDLDSEAPQFTTALRPPPRSSSHLSVSSVPLPASPNPSLCYSSDSHHSVSSPITPQSPEWSESPGPVNDDDSDYESADEGEEDSLKHAHRQRSKPPKLLLRASLPHGPPDTECACADPLCPGGELDRAYDDVLPCNCGFSDCVGGEMALAWKLRADGLRKTGRNRHIKERAQTLLDGASEGKRGIVWGYIATGV